MSDITSYPFTLEQYAMGRDVTYPSAWSYAKPNAIILLATINAFFAELNYPNELKISSGFRPNAINMTVANAAKKSLHMSGKAIDLADPDGAFKQFFTPLFNTSHSDLLRKHGLFMEHPDATIGWVHFDVGDRIDRPTRVFQP